jgi:hypothetical protein
LITAGAFASSGPTVSARSSYQGADHAFFLEWDRGTERNGALDRKLDCYEAYYRTRHHYRGPVLLIVTTTTKREHVFRREILKVSGRGGAVQRLTLTTSAPLLEAQGPFGAIWRSTTDPKRRQWPGDDTTVLGGPRA